MLELLRKKKSLRILIVAGAAIAALAGAVYLYFHNPPAFLVRSCRFGRAYSQLRQQRLRSP